MSFHSRHIASFLYRGRDEKNGASVFLAKLEQFPESRAFGNKKCNNE
jgi:hypothetical protein